jgi:putative ABC transport system substrate-binding protein
MRRRDFIKLFGGAAVWPLAAAAQQGALPVIAFVSARSAVEAERYAAAFRKGLNVAGVVENQNATVEYHWLDCEYGRLPSLTADLIRRRVAMIGTTGNTPSAIAAKVATTTIPIVFSVAEDPVSLGLVGCCGASPGRIFSRRPSLRPGSCPASSSTWRQEMKSPYSPSTTFVFSCVSNSHKGLREC